MEPKNTANGSNSIYTYDFTSEANPKDLTGQTLNLKVGDEV